MNEYLNNQTKLFVEGSKKVFERRKQWDEFEKRALELINDFILDAKKINYYESLYVITDKELPRVRLINQSFIQFYAGKHPIGIQKVELDQNSKQTTSSISEDSGCLSIVQEPKGGVFFIAYPSKSDVLHWKDEFIVLKYFPNAKEIVWHDIRKAIEFYLRFARYSSVYSEQTFYEKIELWWMKFKFKNLFIYLYKGAAFSFRVISAAKTGLPAV
ncbi:hypothetical protein [Flavobacterium sp.]|jgi:hypothetical protein|uniref:hypothetical protein n=1 Tax=Flavobacterium sp. TaxID=239 RepID=UPI0031DA5E0D